MTWLPRNASTVAPRTARVDGTPGRARGEVGPAATVPVTSEAGGPAPGRWLPQATTNPATTVSKVSLAPGITCVLTSRVAARFRHAHRPSRSPGCRTPWFRTLARLSAEGSGVGWRESYRRRGAGPSRSLAAGPATRLAAG